VIFWLKNPEGSNALTWMEEQFLIHVALYPLKHVSVMYSFENTNIRYAWRMLSFSPLEGCII
jgi:hypothetical protein